MPCSHGVQTSSLLKHKHPPKLQGVQAIGQTEVHTHVVIFNYMLQASFLRVSWKDHVPNQEILRWDELTGIEAMLNQAQLRWSGHVTRMDDSRLPKQLFHAELSTGKRHKGGQRKWYKDVLKSTLKACNIPVDEWQALAQDRPAWRAATRKGTKHFERRRL